MLDQTTLISLAAGVTQYLHW